jgi:hypothetical protein
MGYKGCMENDDVKKLTGHFEVAFNALDYISIRVEALRTTLEELVPGFHDAYEKALTQARCSADIASTQSPQRPTEAQQIARLIVDLRSDSQP